MIGNNHIYAPTEVGESEELNSIICVSFKENTIKSSFLKIKLGD